VKGKIYVRVSTVQPKKQNKTHITKPEQGEGKQSFLSTIFASFRKEDASVLEVVPYKRIDSKTGILIDKRGHFQAYLKVKTTDLVSMNQDDLKSHMNQLTNLCRVYHEPFKILSLTYSAETSEQQMYWKRVATRYQKILNKGGLAYEQEQAIYHHYSLAVEQVNRVIWVEKNLKELAFFIVVYAKTQKEIEKNVNDMIRYSGRQLSLKRMSPKEIEKLIFKLNNMNSEL